MSSRGSRSEEDDMDSVALIEAPRPPTFCNRDFGPWYQYRQTLVQRHADWSSKLGARPDDLRAAVADEVPRIFPPPAFSKRLAAGSRWRPGFGTRGRNVIVTIGGVFGGFDGPAGLYEYISLVLHDVTFLKLDGGHTLEVSAAVLQAALEWLLSAHPETHGRIILCGFSMGSSSVASAIDRFGDALCGIVIVAGQSSRTEGFSGLGHIPLLLVYGSDDLNMSPDCGRSIAAHAEATGSGEICFRILDQVADHIDKPFQRMCLHHLWSERWDMQAIVLEFCRKCHKLSAASRRVSQAFQPALP